MAKQGMKHDYTRHEEPGAPSVPQISGKAKSGKEKAKPLIPGTHGKVYHAVPHAAADAVPSAFPTIDNDLAAENLENNFDMTAADLLDLE